MSRSIHSSHWGAFHPVVTGETLVGVEPFGKDPAPSSILDAIPGMVHSPSRVQRPSIRRGWLEGRRGGPGGVRGDDSYVEVSWDEALDLVAGELLRVRRDQGNSAIFAGSYGWSSAGRFNHARSQLHRFMNLFGGFTAQVNSYSFAAAQAVLPHIVGTLEPLVGPLPSWDGIAGSTKIMLCFGGIPHKNTQVESGGLGEHNSGQWLRQCAEQGTRFIAVSPIRQDAPAGVPCDWMPIRPNTDTALILALCHWLLINERYDAAFVKSHCVGFDHFRDYLTGRHDRIAKTAEWASAITGIDAGMIDGLARQIADNRTLVAGAWSLQRAEFGEQPYWAIIALASMLGGIGLPGGGFGFGYGAESGLGNPRQRISNPTLSLGVNPVPNPIPVARISDMLLQPGEPYQFNGGDFTYPDIRLVYWCGGNPFHHHQDLNRLAEAFQRPETVIVNECWWTSTAKHADIVLPASTTLERDDLGAASRDRFLIAMKQAIPAVGEARSDYAIFSGLAARTGLTDAFTEGRDETDWIAHLYEQAARDNRARGIDFPPFKEFWQAGHVEVPVPNAPHLPFQAFREDPVAHPLATPSGRIELFSERVASFGYDDCPGLPVWRPPVEWLGAALAEDFPLHLISNQPATRLHSQMDAAGTSMGSKINGREPVTLNPIDAAARGIGEGDTVRIWNHRGAVLAGVLLSEDLLPGVVQLATGAWYDPDRPGGIDRHGNPNVLTRDAGCSRLSQAPVAHSCLVDIEKWTGPDLPVRAHIPPPITTGADLQAKQDMP